MPGCLTLPHGPAGSGGRTEPSLLPAHVARGLRNGEIAERLVISPETVRTHVGRVLSKLRARDRAGLVVIAYETGLVRPGDHET